jgi:DNA polymerase-3 subunit epsilon
MSSWVFLDLETTGASARGDRITEVGLIRVEDGVEVDEWSQLVNPGMSIPPEIVRLTGISNAMVARAPAFSEIATALLERIGDAVMVAHNARFDFGFLKSEYARLGITFSAKTLCTVRLSRALHPEQQRHNLDTLIERHGLAGIDRHRALGDTRAICTLFRKWQADTDPETFDAAINRLLQRPSLPSHLDPDALRDLPQRPGVYLFYGLNPLPLYIGKAVNLKDRIGSHFSNDYRSGTDLRLSQELRRIEVEETAGELGALLREAQLVKQLMPAHNIKLRRKNAWTAIRIDAETGLPEYVKSDDIPLDALDTHYGLFGSRAAARSWLLDTTAEAGLCAKALGLERGTGPCFGYQLRQCRGTCIGLEPAAQHLQRVRDALEVKQLKHWPYAGPISIVEKSADLLREDWHVIDQWCYLGTVRSEAAAWELARDGARRFDLDAYQLVLKHLDAEPIEPFRHF